MTAVRLAACGLAAAANLALAPAAQGQNPFDPKAYIDDKVDAATKTNETLSVHAIYKIDGHRYHRVGTAAGTVWLPGEGDVPTVREEFTLCEQHMRLLREVLLIRDGVKIEPELKKLERPIVDLIHKCQEGLIRSPTATIETADGAVVEIKAKEKKEKVKPGGDSDQR
jgi:hypothetical protein